MNIVILEGNLTKDPEMRYTPSGKAVAEFSLAINEGPADKRTTTFIDCVVWEEFAERVADQARKGMRLSVVGRWTNETWTDRQTQAKRKASKVTCQSVAIHAPRRAQPADQAPASRPSHDDEELDLLAF